MFHLEGIKITLFLHYTERFNRINMLFTVSGSISSYQFQTDSIIQAFLIDYISNGIFLTAFDSSLEAILHTCP